MIEYYHITFKLSDSSLITCSIIHTPRNDEFNSTIESYYKKIDGIMLVYDISDIKTFEKIKNYYSIKIKELCKEETYIILVGNKTDKENKRKVSQNDGLELQSR